MRLTVPAAAGSLPDRLAPITESHLEKVFGQPFITENKPGATGAIGTMAVLQAPADGYNLLFSNASLAVSMAALKSDLRYYVLKDLIPIEQIGKGGVLLRVSPTLLFKSVGELFDAVRKEPGKFSYGSASEVSIPHLLMTSILAPRGLDMLAVQYKGSAVVRAAMLSGKVQVGLPEPTVYPMTEQGCVRAFAVASTLRLPKMPDLPTLSKAGIPSAQRNGWFSMLAPAGTPAPIIDAINAEVRKLMQSEAGNAHTLAANTANPPCRLTGGTWPDHQPRSERLAQDRRGIQGQSKELYQARLDQASDRKPTPRAQWEEYLKDPPSLHQGRLWREMVGKSNQRREHRLCPNRHSAEVRGYRQSLPNGAFGQDHCDAIGQPKEMTMK